MKKLILLFVIILTTIAVKAQNITNYLAKSSQIENQQQIVELDKLIFKYAVFEIPTESIFKGLVDKNYNFVLQLGNEYSFDLSLIPNKITANN